MNRTDEEWNDLWLDMFFWPAGKKTPVVDITKFAEIIRAETRAELIGEFKAWLKKNELEEDMPSLSEYVDEAFKP